jgi:hypothetical protein
LKQIRFCAKVAEISALSVAIQTGGGLSQMIEPVTRESVEASLATRGIRRKHCIGRYRRPQIQTVAYANIMEWLMETQKSCV